MNPLSPTCATCRHGTREYWQVIHPPTDPREIVVYCHAPAVIAHCGGPDIRFADEGCEGWEAGEQAKQLPLLWPWPEGSVSDVTP